MNKRILLAILIFTTSIWSETPKVVASVNSHKISRYQLASLLNDRYKIYKTVKRNNIEAQNDVIDSLQPRVVKAALEELITLDVTNRKLKTLNIVCQNQDYVEEAKRSEKPFFNLYAKWGLKHPISFTESMYKIISKDAVMKKNHGKTLKKLRLKIRLVKKDLEEMLKIWREIEKSKKLHGKARQVVFAKHSITMRNFKGRVKVNALLRKYVVQNKNEAEVQKILNNDSFALSGGVVRLSHILLFTKKPGSKLEFSAEEQNKIYEKILNVKSKLQTGSDFSKMAEKYSDDGATKFSGGDLGYVPRWGIFAKEIIREAYLSKKGDIKGPIKTDFGYHLIKIIDRKKGKDLSVDKLRKKANDRYISVKKEELLKKWYDDAQIKRYYP